MDRYQRFKLLDAVGSQVLPVLVALPDVKIAPGTRPPYSNRRIQEIVRGLVGDGLGRLQRLVTVKARTALVQTALAHIPPRAEPGAVGPAQAPRGRPDPGVPGTAHQVADVCRTSADGAQRAWHLS